MGFKGELHDQLDALEKVAMGTGWRWTRGLELGWGLENDQGRGRKCRLRE